MNELDLLKEAVEKYRGMMDSSEENNRLFWWLSRLYLYENGGKHVRRYTDYDALFEILRENIPDDCDDERSMYERAGYRDAMSIIKSNAVIFDNMEDQYKESDILQWDTSSGAYAECPHCHKWSTDETTDVFIDKYSIYFQPSFCPSCGRPLRRED